MQNSLNVLQESQSLQTATDGTDRKNVPFKIIVQQVTLQGNVSIAVGQRSLLL